MKVTLVNYTSDPEKEISNAAGLSRASGPAMDPTRRVKYLIEAGHLSVLRFAYATFNIEQVSRVCSHQLVRVAHMGIVQESQRYTKGSLQYITPESFSSLPEAVQQKVQRIQKATKDLHNEIRMLDVPLEDARFVLMQGIVTDLAVTANFQVWHTFLKARLSNYAQWEVRQVAREIHRHLYKLAPNVFEGMT